MASLSLNGLTVRFCMEKKSFNIGKAGELVGKTCFFVLLICLILHGKKCTSALVYKCSFCSTIANKSTEQQGMFCFNHVLLCICFLYIQCECSFSSAKSNKLKKQHVCFALITHLLSIHRTTSWKMLMNYKFKAQTLTGNPTRNLHCHVLASHPLTHWGRVTHTCISKLSILGSDNGLSPGRRQAII